LSLHTQSISDLMQAYSIAGTQSRFIIIMKRKRQIDVTTEWSDNSLHKRHWDTTLDTIHSFLTVQSDSSLGLLGHRVIGVSVASSEVGDFLGAGLVGLDSTGKFVSFTCNFLSKFIGRGFLRVGLELIGSLFSKGLAASVGHVCSSTD